MFMFHCPFHFSLPSVLSLRFAHIFPCLDLPVGLSLIGFHWVTILVISSGALRFMCPNHLSLCDPECPLFLGSSAWCIPHRVFSSHLRSSYHSSLRFPHIVFFVDRILSSWFTRHMILSILLLFNIFSTFPDKISVSKKKSPIFSVFPFSCLHLFQK